MPERPDLSEFVERTKNRGFPFSPRTLNEARVEFFRPEFEELLRLRAENERLRECLEDTLTWALRPELEECRTCDGHGVVGSDQ